MGLQQPTRTITIKSSQKNCPDLGNNDGFLSQYAYFLPHPAVNLLKRFMLFCVYICGGLRVYICTICVQDVLGGQKMTSDTLEP